MDCKKEKNLSRCICSASCSTKGLCCDCLAYHLSQKQLTGCCFPPEAKKTWDRSFKNFAKAWKL